MSDLGESDCEGCVVKVEDVAEALGPEQAVGGGEDQEGEVFGGRGDLGVLPIEDDAGEVVVRVVVAVAVQQVLLPQLPVDAVICHTSHIMYVKCYDPDNSYIVLRGESGIWRRMHWNIVLAASVPFKAANLESV